VKRTHAWDERIELLEPAGIGASEAPAMLGVDPWTTPLQLWRRKLGRTLEREDSQAMRVGRALEGPVVELARELLPVPVRRNRKSYTHPGWPTVPMFATPDGFAGCGDLKRGVEVKVVGYRSAADWDDGVPQRVQLQTQAQMEVCDIPAVWVIALVGTELRVELVERDPLVGDVLREGAVSFMELVREVREPDPVTDAERWERLAALSPREEVELLADDLSQHLGAKLLEVRAEIAALEQSEALLRERLAANLNDLGTARLRGDGFVASWADRAGTVDWPRLVDELVAIEGLDRDALVARYRKPASRTFSVRATKGAIRGQ
jgi:putative phage-type endonuclease